MWRNVGILDIAAVAVVLFVLILPAQESSVESAYLRYTEEPSTIPARTAEIAALQARLARQAGDGAAAEELGRVLEEYGQHDMALRVAGTTAAAASPTRWRAELAVASAHAERIELAEAFAWSEQALASCVAAAATCRADEQVRLQLFVEELRAAVAAIEAGADPLSDPESFRRKLQELHPRATFREGRGERD